MARLDFFVDQERFLRLKLREEGTLIGRGPECDIQLPTGTVSRHHCRIAGSGDGGFILEDLSTNGTRVNAAMVRGRAELSPGDRIYIDNYVLVFQENVVAAEDVDVDGQTILGGKLPGLS